MESLATMRDLPRQGNWMALIGLEEAYLSVLVWEGHQKYLCYMWQENTYEFQSPFGLCSAPRDFTKLLKPVLAWLHHQGVRVVMYQDDMLIMSQLKDELGETAEPDYVPIGKTGLRDQQKEVISAAYPVNSVTGLYGGLSRDFDQSYRGEGDPDHSSM